MFTTHEWTVQHGNRLAISSCSAAWLSPLPSWMSERLAMSSKGPFKQKQKPNLGGMGFKGGLVSSQPRCYKLSSSVLVVIRHCKLFQNSKNQGKNHHVMLSCYIRIEQQNQWNNIGFAMGAGRRGEASQFVWKQLPQWQIWWVFFCAICE